MNIAPINPIRYSNVSFGISKAQTSTDKYKEQISEQSDTIKEHVEFLSNFLESEKFNTFCTKIKDALPNENSPYFISSGFGGYAIIPETSENPKVFYHFPKAGKNPAITLTKDFGHYYERYSYPLNENGKLDDSNTVIVKIVNPFSHNESSAKYSWKNDNGEISVTLEAIKER